MQGAPKTTADNPSVYRHGGEGARSHLEDLLRLRREESDALPGEVYLVFARRLARIAAAGASILGAIVLVLAALFFLGESQGELTLILLGASVAAIPAYFIAGFWAQRTLKKKLTRIFSPGEDVFTDIDRVTRLRPLQAVREMAEPLERASIALPLIAKALLIPLTIHFLVAVLAGYEDLTLSDFDGWINFSWLLVGHSHVVLAYLCWRFTKKLHSSDQDVFHVFPVGNDWGKAYGLTVASSAIPGLALFAIPVIIVALTGLVFIPFMFHGIKNQIMRERATLEMGMDVGSALR